MMAYGQGWGQGAAEEGEAKTESMVKSSAYLKKTFLPFGSTGTITEL